MRFLLRFGLTVCAAPIDDLLAVIRNGDHRRVERQLKGSGLANFANASGMTPLMQAVHTADARMVSIVLAGGANPNAKSVGGITPLLAAVFDEAKTRALLGAGANPNAASDDGRAPLHAAAMREGSAAIVKLLLAKGADPNAAPARAANRVPLRNAGDIETIRALIAAGAAPAKADPLAYFGIGDCAECMRELVTHCAGATVGSLARWANIGDLEVVKTLVEKGAPVSANAGRGYTPLMRAAMSYRRDPEVVRYLLQKGADVSAKNEIGFTALTWARRLGDRRIVELLEAAKAPEGPKEITLPPPVAHNTARAAIERGIPLMQRSAPLIPQKRGCTSCHNNLQVAQVLAHARKRGFAVDEAAAAKEMDELRKARAKALDQELTGALIPEIASFQLFAMKDLGVAPSAVTEAAVQLLAFRQSPSGRWKVDDHRPPQEYTSITYTAISAKALRDYAPPGRAAEMRERVVRARAWLLSAPAEHLEEKAMRLLGLKWTGAAQSEIAKASAALVKDQRGSGAWAQLTTTEDDAYATGLALYALHVGGAMKTSDAIYKKGVQYLVETQRPDGSWFVRSRVFPLQAFFESGFPYGHDQWISAAGTAWALQAILFTLPETK